MLKVHEPAMKFDKKITLHVTRGQGLLVILVFSNSNHDEIPANCFANFEEIYFIGDNHQ
jgi:hypothetical protein